MKILHISTFDSGGAGLCCIRIHKGLLEQGYSSKVLVLNKVSDVTEVYKYESKKIRLPKIVRWPWLFVKLILFKLRIPVSRFQKLKFELDNLRRIYSPVYSLPLSDYALTDHPLVKEADIIHLHWVSGFLDWPSFFETVSKPVIWTIHDENLYLGGFHYRKERNNYISAFKNLEEKVTIIKRNSLLKCNNLTIVSLSKMMLELSLSNQIVKERKHYVINNMVDHTIFKPYNREFSRKVFSLPENKTVILFISYYLNDKRKGFDDLIMALNDLKIIDVVLFAIGVGKTEINTSFQIYYPGPINDQRFLAVAYSASDIYVMPSSEEAFAQTPLEAMACGLPVVTYPCSGTEELINEKNGIRTEDFSQTALKSGILRSIKTDFNSEYILRDVLNRFGTKHIVNQYVNVYKDILKIS